MPELRIELSVEDAEQLRRICGPGPLDVAADVRGLVEHLARAAADGVRRPGSWERDWLTQATGWPPYGSVTTA